ncbi:hypothetical protein BDV93DRAFT_509334 [Ceratobasidium sp. AG-I]|nr:hypothetical protein BDV93DRAFT_509334 [Ceratobasidium sp. AG-I]
MTKQAFRWYQPPLPRPPASDRAAELYNGNVWTDECYCARTPIDASHPILSNPHRAELVSLLLSHKTAAPRPSHGLLRRITRARSNLLFTHARPSAQFGSTGSGPRYLCLSSKAKVLYTPTPLLNVVFLFGLRRSQALEMSSVKDRERRSSIEHNAPPKCESGCGNVIPECGYSSPHGMAFKAVKFGGILFDSEG